MKRIFALAAAALAVFTACTNIENAAVPQSEVTFMKVNYAAQTKAGETPYSTAIPFGTYAWAQDPQGTADQVYMSNQEVSFQQDVWKATGATYYWPKRGTVDFISYSPKAVAPQPVINPGAITVTDYVVEDKTTTDLLFADKVTGMSANYATKYYYAGVPTLFRHALAKINIVIKQTALSDGLTPATTWKMEVKKVELLDIINKGSLAMTVNEDPTISQDEFKTYQWSLPSATNKVGWVPGTQKISPVVNEDVNELTTEGVYVLKDYFVLPQNLAADSQRVRLTVDITTKNAGGFTTTEKNVQLTGDLKTDKIDLWGMNQNITYTITIAPGMEEIYFDPAVAPWDDVDGGIIEFK